MAYTLTDDQRETLEYCLKLFRSAEANQKQEQEKMNHLFRLYVSYRRDRDQYNWSQPRDIYPATRELTDKWGAELFIPYCFSTVETVKPRILSTHPKMLILPLEDEIEDQVENMKALIDQQQSQIDIELRFQDVLTDGLIYGLGVGKSYWKYEPGMKTITRPRTIPLPGLSKYVVEQVPAAKFDDACFSAVDPFDWFRDPMGTDMDGLEWAFHRTWQSHDYVLDKIMEGEWTGLSPDDVEEQSGAQHYQAAHADRWQAAGLARDSARKDIHEVWELHHKVRQTVFTVLDRQVPVRQEPFYQHRELPFQVYRPTRVRGQFMGIGEVEPIEDLQHEMNSLRRQRRDSATIVLHPVGFYTQGLFDEDDIQWGPGILNAVPGNPQEAIYFPRLGDLPGSSYRESDEIASDINMASGLSDAIRGADVAPSTTATATQLVQAAANARIQLKARRLEAELIKPAARQWLLLNQQYIVQDAQKRVRIPEAIEPGQLAPKYKHVKLGPMELQGDMYIEPEGGSTQPENVPQDRQDATNLWNALRDNPNVDQRMLLSYCLKKWGVKMADAFLTPHAALDPKVLDMIVNVHPELKPLIDQAIQMAQAQDGAEAAQAAQGDQQPQPEPAMDGAPA